VLSPGCIASLLKTRIGVLQKDVLVGPGSPSNLPPSLSIQLNPLIHGYIACIVSKVLEAEPTIRIILVACRLSSSLRQASVHPGPNLNLPVLDFWLSSLRTALNEDPFWGPDFRPHLENRAETLEKGIRSLVQQCVELEELVKRDAANKTESAAVIPVKSHRYASNKPTGLRTSKLAERQMSVVEEENDWMQRVVLGCWTTLLADAARARRKASVSKGAVHQPLRARCLTS